MRDAAAFTVDDPRFSTGQVIGPSMLSLDGDEHGRHRAPFTAPFRPGAVGERFAAPVAAEAERLIESFAPPTATPSCAARSLAPLGRVDHHPSARTPRA